MKVNRIERICAGILLLLAMVPFIVYAEDQGETARLIQQLRPPPKIAEKDKIYIGNYYEPSFVLEGNRTGQWWENTTTFGYAHQNITGYGSISQLSRLGVLDNTFNVGAYINIDKDQYAHMEVGFGGRMSTTYISCRPSRNMPAGFTKASSGR